MPFSAWNTKPRFGLLDRKPKLQINEDYLAVPAPGTTAFSDQLWYNAVDIKSKIAGIHYAKTELEQGGQWLGLPTEIANQELIDLVHAFTAVIECTRYIPISPANPGQKQNFVGINLTPKMQELVDRRKEFEGPAHALVDHLTVCSRALDAVRSTLDAAVALSRDP